MRPEGRKGNGRRERPLRAPGGLALTLEADGRFRAEAALGADLVLLAPEVVTVLAAFARPRRPSEAVRDLAARAREAPPTRAALRQAVARLRRAGLLVGDGPGERASGALESAAFADVEVQRRLLADVRRVERFGAAIARVAPGRSVLEIGTGTGVLAVLAARAGARCVTAVEETAVAALAREVVARNGVADCVKVVEASSREVEPEGLADGRRAEVLVAELLGGDPLDERLLDSVGDARARLLAPGAVLVPRAVSVCAVLVEARDERLDAGRRTAELDEASRALGVDLAPVREALEGRPPASFCAEVRHLEAGGGARLLTGEQVLVRFDLDRDEAPALAARALDVDAHVRVRATGLATAVAAYFRADLGHGVEVTNAPFAPETDWGQLILPLRPARPVVAGFRVRLVARVRGGRLEVELPG